MQRQRALELEDFFDEQLAPALRQLASFELARDPRAYFMTAFPDSSPAVRAALRPGAAATIRLVALRYGITPESAAVARAQILAAMDRLEAEIGPSGYLAGDAFSIADLTAAALSTPFLRPPERQYLPPEPPPEPLYSFTQEIAARPAGRRVFDIFRRHRGTSAEIGARPTAARSAAAPVAG